jgi:hypothetical protein
MVGQTIDTTMLARLLDSREWTKKEAKTSENTHGFRAIWLPFNRFEI